MMAVFIYDFSKFKIFFDVFTSNVFVYFIRDFLFSVMKIDQNETMIKFASKNIFYTINANQRLRESVNIYIYFIAHAYAHMPCRSKRLRVTIRIKPNAKYIAATKPQQNPFFIGQCSWHGIGRNNFLLINIMKISLHRFHRAIILTSDAFEAEPSSFCSCRKYSTDWIKKIKWWMKKRSKKKYKTPSISFISFSYHLYWRSSLRY